MLIALFVQATLLGMMVGLGVYSLENGRPAWFYFASAAFVLVMAIHAAIISAIDNR